MRHLRERVRQRQRANRRAHFPSENDPQRRIPGGDLLPEYAVLPGVGGPAGSFRPPVAVRGAVKCLLPSSDGKTSRALEATLSEVWFMRLQGVFRCGCAEGWRARYGL
jgi:hypothetical protein